MNHINLHATLIIYFENVNMIVPIWFNKHKQTHMRKHKHTQTHTNTHVHTHAVTPIYMPTCHCIYICGERETSYILSLSYPIPILSLSVCVWVRIAGLGASVESRTLDAGRQAVAGALSAHGVHGCMSYYRVYPRHQGLYPTPFIYVYDYVFLWLCFPVFEMIHWWWTYDKYYSMFSSLWNDSFMMT